MQLRQHRGKVETSNRGNSVTGLRGDTQKRFLSTKRSQRYLVTVLIGLVVAGLVTWQTRGQHLPGGDSATIATMVAKDMRPGLYPRDAFYRSDRWYRLYTPSYRSLLAYLTPSPEQPEPGLRIILFVSVALYVIFMIAFLHALCGNFMLSSLITLASLPLRWALEGEVWGINLFDPLGTAGPRTIFLSFVPLTLWLLLKWLDRAVVMLAFLVIGLSINFHPVTGQGLFLTAMAVLLCCSKMPFLSRIGTAAGCVVATAVGAAPFVLHFKSTSKSQLGAYSYDELMKYAHANLQSHFLPADFNQVADVLKSALLLALLALWLTRAAWDSTERRRELGALWVFAVAALLLPVFVQAAVQIICALLQRAPLPEFMRATRLLYPPLFAIIAIGLQRAYHIFPRRKMLWTAIVFALVLLLSPTLTKQAWRATIQPIRALLGKPNAWRYAEAERAEQEREQQFHALAAWARTKTAPDALFYFDPMVGHASLFRVYGLRSITGMRSDIGPIYFADPATFMKSADRIKALKEPFRLESPQQLMATARRVQANYVVVDKSFPAVPLPVAYRNKEFRVYRVSTAREAPR